MNSFVMKNVGNDMEHVNVRIKFGTDITFATSVVNYSMQYKYQRQG